jgi:hypothetical protein
MTASGLHRLRMGPMGWICFAMAVAFALWTGKVSWFTNLDYVCQSKQWPVLDVCSRSSVSGGEDPAGPEWSRLRARVAANPGDGLTMAEMARYAGFPAPVIGMDGSVLLREVTKVAPQRTEVLQQQAVRALSRQDWEPAVAGLVRLSVRHGDPEASRALARLMVLAGRDERLSQVLRGAVQDGSGWGERAVAAMRAEKLPFSSAVSLLSEMIVSGAIKPPTGLVVVRELKSEGRWLDAHAVWLQLWKRPLDLIHNGDFERDFVPNAFDWDFADGRSSSLGAHVDRIGAKDRGEVLRIQFTGQAVRSPVLKHDLFLPAGTYRLDSEVRLSDVRGAGGFVWTVTCIDGGRQLARSEPLISPDRQWASLTFALDVPDACQASTLALVPGSSAEARSGATGEMLLDRVRLTRRDGTAQMAVR